MILFSLLLALGAFSPIWLGRSLLGVGQPGNDWAFGDGDPLGGLYWFFSLMLPKFAAFRYPVKYLTAAMIGFAFLAGLGFDRLFSEKTDGEPSRRVAKIARRIVWISLAALAVFGLTEMVGWSVPGTINAGRGVDFRLTDARIQIGAALVQPILILVAFLLLLRRKNGKLLAAGIFLLFVLDMAWTSAGFVPTTAESDLAQTPEVARTMKEANAGSDPSIALGPNEDGSTTPPCRFFTASIDWLAYPSPEIRGNRRAQLVSEWQRETLYPKHPGVYGVGIMEMGGTMLPASIFQLESWLAIQNQERGPMWRVAESMLAYCDVDFYLLQDGDSLETGRLLKTSPSQLLTPETVAEDWPVGAALWESELLRRRIRIIRPKESNPNPTDDPLSATIAPFTVPTDPVDGESVRLTEYEANRLVFEARLKREGEILLAEQFWPGWEAVATPLTGENGGGVAPEGGSLTVEPDDLTKMLRKVALPSGSWRVEMVYRPKPLKTGAVLSLIGIFIALGLLLAHRWARKRHFSPNELETSRTRV